jgi:RNA polymerase sigma-70 factor, ECF subfamily
MLAAVESRDVATLTDADLDRLLPEVYADLRRLAASVLRGERPGHTLQPTALVHEAYLRLAAQHGQFKDRGHLLAVAACMMRRVLVDHARARAAARRSGGVRVTLGDEVRASAPAVELLALDQALERLAATDPRLVRLVELRCFAGLSVDDAAAALGVSAATAKRDWALARAFVERELEGGGGP